MAALQSNEPIGTIARLGLARLGAVRLGVLPFGTQLTSTGRYAWVRSDGTGSAVNDGRPSGAEVNAWTTVRS